MRSFIVLGVALLCMSQVQGEEDLLRALFQEKTSQLKAAKEPVFVPTVVLAEDKFDCDAQKIVAVSQTLAKNTVDIFADSFNVVYNAVYIKNSKCTFNAFRCFLKEFTDTRKTLSDVSKKVLTYKDTATGLYTDIYQYFQHCPKKNAA